MIAGVAPQVHVRAPAVGIRSITISGNHDPDGAAPRVDAGANRFSIVVEHPRGADGDSLRQARDPDRGVGVAIQLPDIEPYLRLQFLGSTDLREGSHLCTDDGIVATETYQADWAGTDS